MKTHWSFHACAAVLVGFVFTACDKEQMGQFLKTVQTGGCTENKPSNAAPEYCLYVEDVQVSANNPSNQTVNVVFKLVNRTRRTLYLGIQNWRAAGSSGNSYTGNGTTGIPYCQPCVPLAAEPGADTIFSANVSRTGVGDIANDQWISMTGEIGLVKTDPQGKPMFFTPTNFITTRGFNFSRLSLTAQQPAQRLQGSTPAPQSASTQLASSNVQESASPGVSINSSTATRAVPSLGAATSGSTSVPGSRTWESLDIIGLKTGISSDEFKQRLKKNEIPLEIRVAEAELADVPNTRHVSYIVGVSEKHDPSVGKYESIGASFAPVPNKSVAGVVGRVRAYPPGQQPTSQNVHEALREKYGPYSILQNIGSGDGEILVWVYDKSGNQIVGPGLDEKCGVIKGNLAPGIGTSHFNQDWVRWGVPCGRAVVVRVELRSNLVWQMSSALIDPFIIEESVARTSSLVSEYKRKIREKELEDAQKQGKPKL